MEELKINDRVSFDIEGSTKPKPNGFGFVSRKTKTSILITPDFPIAGGMRMINIQKVEPKGK